MEIREEGLSYHSSPPHLMPVPPTGMSISGVSTVPVTDSPLGSSILDTSAAGPKQDTAQQTQTGKPSLVNCLPLLTFANFFGVEFFFVDNVVAFVVARHRCCHRIGCGSHCFI